jgi:dihydroneopterin aldolase
MSDTVLLEGIEFYGYHGVPDAEQVVGHRYSVDVEVGCDLAEAGATDDVAKTIDYGELALRVLEIGRRGRFRLIEALAEAVAREALLHPRALHVRVRVRKLLPPIDAIVAAAAVEIQRSR